MDILRDDELLDIYLKAESKDDDWAGIRAIAKTQEEQTKKALIEWCEEPCKEHQLGGPMQYRRECFHCWQALKESKESGGD